MDVFAHLDLLTVGIMVAATCVLGFVVYFNNRESITNKLYLLLSLDIAIWGIINYFAYQFSNRTIAIWLIRGILFFAVFQSLLLYLFFLVFPHEKYTFSKLNKFLVIPITIFTAFLTLTPLIFSKLLDKNVIIGQVTGIEKGILWPIFPIIAAGLVFVSFYILIRKIVKIDKSNRKPFILIFVGIIITYFFILTFNLFLPILFNNTLYIPLSSVFIFPFIALTAYSILRFNLFNLKVTDTMWLMLLLLVTTFIQVIFSNYVTEIIFRSLIFLLVLFITILLLNTVIREVKQKQEIEELHTKLKELDELKSSFVSLATHHISSPLTAVNGYISMLKEQNYNLLSNSGRDMLDAAEQSTSKLVTVVRDFLDVTRLDTGKIKYNFEDVDLEKLILEIIERYEPKIKAKAINFIYSKNIFIQPIIKADIQTLTQAISNIIDNSLKYTTEGEIKMLLESNSTHIILTINDTGVRNLPLISPTLKNKFSNDNSTNSDFEINMLGNSLGLFAAKQIIDAHNGKLTIHGNSTGVDFRINLV